MRRAQGSVVRYKSGWRVHATIHDELGNPRRVSRVVHGTRKDAERVLASLLDGDYSPAPLTVSQLCDMYLAACDARIAAGDIEPRTVKEYRAHIRNHIKPALGDMLAKHVKPSHVEAFVASLRRNRNAVYKTMRQVFNYGVTRDVVPSNPTAKVKAPKTNAGAVGRDGVYTKAECAAILSRPMPRPLLLAVTIALGCGLRRGEICALLWQDIALDGDTMRVAVSKAYGKSKPKTPSSVRVVSVPPFAREILAPLRREAGFVIANDDGEQLHPDTVTHLWRRFLRDNPDVRRLPFKNLRHTSLTLAYLATVGANGVGDIRAVSRRGGHASIGITSLYYLREPSEIDDALGDAMTL